MRARLKEAVEIIGGVVLLVAMIGAIIAISAMLTP